MKRIALICCLLAGFGLQAFAQVVTLKEYGNDNKLLTVEKPFIVGINSTLQININKDILLDSLVDMLGENTYPSEALVAISKALSNQKKTLTAIMTTGKRKERLAALNSFRTELASVLIPLTQLDTGSALRKAANRALLSNNYAVFFDTLNNQYAKITKEYADKVSASTAYFKLGAWLNTSSGATQVHLDGFDSIANGQFYQVKRFVTSIPQSEVNAYNSARTLADSLQTYADTLVALMKNRFLNGVNGVEAKVTNILQTGINGFKQNLDSVANQAKTEFYPPIDTLTQELNEFKVGLVKLISQVENFKVGEIINMYQEARALEVQGDTIEAHAKALFDKVKAEVQDIPGITKSVSASLIANATGVWTQTKELGQSYIEELEKTLDLFNQNKVTDLSETAAKFSANTFSLSYNDVPAQTDLNLKFTGERTNGDQLYFKAVIGKDSASTTTAKTIYWQKTTMFIQGIYNTIRASLIFANPVNSSLGNPTNEWQLAPSYSAIFRLGTRKSIFYNKYLTPGIGINVATLDFDNNNNPEIGIGLTAAFFQDYLQVGYGRNMGTDDFYWMFGLRLPLFGWITKGATVGGSSVSVPNLN